MFGQLVSIIEKVDPENERETERRASVLESQRAGFRGDERGDDEGSNSDFVAVCRSSRDTNEEDREAAKNVESLSTTHQCSESSTADSDSNVKKASTPASSTRATSRDSPLHPAQTNPAVSPHQPTATAARPELVRSRESTPVRNIAAFFNPTPAAANETPTNKPEHTETRDRSLLDTPSACTQTARDVLQSLPLDDQCALLLEERDGAVELYRSKLAELHDALSEAARFKQHCERCFSSYQAALQRRQLPEATADLLSQIENYELPTVKRTVGEARSWLACVREEAEREATGERELASAASHMQRAIKDLEDRLTAAHEEKNALRDELDKNRVSAAQVQKLLLQQRTTGKRQGDDEMVKVRQKLVRISGELAEKQALVGALYEEKETLRTRLEGAEVRLELMNTVPQQKIDESRVFRSLSGIGPWGVRLHRLADRLDTQVMQLGRFLYSNALIRVTLASYLVVIHVWVFYLVGSYVHMPHMSSPVHDHEHLFKD
ncbi:hypothetical protein DIPPA_32762 [Diplonema papillatum]|nr:hypothetical protein DIPPA_32762 [Diplonema papillatum]